jgi:acetyl esterase/lipase
VKFPANAQDVARAFTWTHANIGKHGGRADRLFLGGHSAGGHLVSLLATDGSYLKAQALALGDIRGVVSISGLYAVPRGRFPLFEDTDEGVRKASPVYLVPGGHPPFLLVYADKDFPGFGDTAEDFRKALRGGERRRAVRAGQGPDARQRGGEDRGGRRPDAVLAVPLVQAVEAGGE